MEQSYSKSLLRDHRGAVTSLDRNGAELIASASEDGSVRLWDLREHRAVQGCTGPFTDGVSCVRFNPHDSNSVLCSCGNTLYEIDLRGGLILREATQIMQTEEDISNFDMHAKQANIVAVADDAGCSRVVDIHTRRVVKTLHRVHSNICSSIHFRPQASWELLTAGMDGILCHWDWSRCKVLSTIDMATVHRQYSDGSSQDGSQLLNPPLIHSAAFLDSRYVTAVTAAGTIVLQRWKSNEACGIYRAHRGMATVLRSLPAAKMCVSAGLDMEIALWKLTGDASNASNNRSSSNRRSSGDNSSNNSSDSSSAALECFWRVQHEEKPNDVICIPSADNKSVQSLVVADTSNNITIYNLC